mgnify:CR=1 FL=1
MQIIKTASTPREHCRRGRKGFPGNSTVTQTHSYTKNINQITNTGYNENYPIFSNTENKLFYTGDYQGTWNLFRYDLDSGKSEPITNSYIITLLASTVWCNIGKNCV